MMQRHQMRTRYLGTKVESIKKINSKMYSISYFYNNYIFY